MISLTRNILVWLGCSCVILAGAPGDRKLVDSVRNGQTELALRLIREDADVRTTDSRGYTPLHWAAANGQTAVLRALLRGWPGISVGAPDGSTALMLAIANGHSEIVRVLLAAGARMDASTPRLARNSDTARTLQRASSLGNALFSAIERRLPNAVNELLAASAPMGFTKAGPSAKRTALEFAVQSGDLAILRSFLEHGARVSDDLALGPCGPYCVSEIGLALLTGHLEGAKLLLATKPTPKAVPWGQVELYKRRRVGRAAYNPEELEAFIEPARRRNRALLDAVKQNDLEKVKRLLAEGADPAPPASPPAVVLAAQNGNAGILRRLLPDGWPAVVNIDAKAFNPETAALINTYRRRRPAPLDQVLRSIRSTAAEGLAASDSTRRIQAAAGWLLERAGQGSQISEEYERALLSVDDLLKRLAATPAPRATDIDAVAEELEDKVAHCKALGIGMGGAVQVEVNTRRAERTVGGWQIFYLLKIYEHAAGRAPERLIGWSSPATGGLEPGRYFFWGVDTASRKVSERILVRLEGKERIQIPLAVP